MHRIEPRPRAIFFFIFMVHDKSHVCIYLDNFYYYVGTRLREQLLQNYNAQRHTVFFKDTLTIEDEKLFKACRSVCSPVC